MISVSAAFEEMETISRTRKYLHVFASNTAGYLGPQMSSLLHLDPSQTLATGQRFHWTRLKYHHHQWACCCCSYHPPRQHHLSAASFSQRRCRVIGSGPLDVESDYQLPLQWTCRFAASVAVASPVPWQNHHCLVRDQSAMLPPVSQYCQWPTMTATQKEEVPRHCTWWGTTYLASSRSCHRGLCLDSWIFDPHGHCASSFCPDVMFSSQWYHHSQL